MKVKIVKEVKKSDGLWRFACGDVLVSEGSKNLGAMKLVIYSINLGIFI